MQALQRFIAQELRYNNNMDRLCNEKGLSPLISQKKKLLYIYLGFWILFCGSNFILLQQNINEYKIRYLNGLGQF